MAENATRFDARKIERSLWGCSLIAAPALFGLSTFFWNRADGRAEYGATGGALVAIATVFWIPAFVGLFDLLKDKAPRYAAAGLMAAIYGCVGGVGFGLDGLFAEAFGLSHQTRLDAWARFPTAFNVVLFWPGPLFPLSLLVLGAMLVRTRSVPRWAGILICLSGVAFPLSRIPRVAAVAHAADVLLFVPLAYVGWDFLQAASTHRPGVQA